MAEKCTGERNFGIDAFRILSMLIICTQHILGPGGVYDGALAGSAQQSASLFMSGAVLCCVNCYALISGYVGIEAEFKWSRLVSIWLQVVFYMLVITSCFQIFYPSAVTRMSWVNVVLPVTCGAYWYITAYFGLFLFVPLLNAAFHHVSKQLMAQMLAAALLLFSLLPLFFEPSSYGLQRGCSTVWLMLLYLIGAFIKTYAPAVSCGKKRLVLICVYVLSAAAVWLSSTYGSGALAKHNSPAILLEAVALLLLFKDIQFKSKLSRRVISAFAPTTLGVYLIHVQPLLFEHIISGRLAFLSGYGVGIMLLLVVLLTLAIFIVCSLIDMLRLWLFKLLKIKRLASRVDTLLMKAHTV